MCCLRACACGWVVLWVGMAEMPHVNILSKIDLIRAFGRLGYSLTHSLAHSLTQSHTLSLTRPLFVPPSLPPSESLVTFSAPSATKVPSRVEEAQ